MAPHIRSHRERRDHASWKRCPSAVVGTVRITQLDWKRVPQARSRGCKCSVAITSSLPLPPSHPVPAPQIRSHDFWRCINLYVAYVCRYVYYPVLWVALDTLRKCDRSSRGSICDRWCLWPPLVEIVISRRNYMRRLCGACTMLALLGVPWIFSAFGVVDASENETLRTIQTCFGVSNRRSLSTFNYRTFLLIFSYFCRRKTKKIHISDFRRRLFRCFLSAFLPEHFFWGNNPIFININTIEKTVEIFHSNL